MTAQERGTERNRTVISARSFGCSCGYAEIFKAGTSEDQIGRTAADHIATQHPRETPGLRNVGCLSCECKAIFEPTVSSDTRCGCGHVVGKHDLFCCVLKCENVIPHSGTTIVNVEQHAAYFLCEQHLEEIRRR
jgi:hypothetical protein